MSELWKPHGYMLTAISFLLSNRRAGLFLDPGLGKTSISLAAIKILINSGMTRGKGVLIVAPLRVVHNVWPEEIHKWSNFNDITYNILHEEGKKSLWGEQKNIYLINPEGLKWLYEELLWGLQSGEKCPFNILWIDESTKFKNPEAEARFLLIKDMRPLFNRSYIMTGTPAPRALLDLWSQTFILDEGAALGNNFVKFRDKFYTRGKYNKYNWELNDFSEGQIHDAIAPLILDMSADDYLDMPPLSYNDIYIDLPPKALKYYKEMEREFLIKIDDLTASADATAIAGGKCHQIANGQVYEDIPDDLDEEEEREFRKTRKTLFVHDAKIEALKDLIGELNGKPLLVGYHYKHDLKALRKALGKDIPHIGSGVSPTETDRIKADWNAGKIPVLLGHPVSMGHGLNMQGAAQNICFFSLTWNLEDYLQFFKRVYRQGVKGAVMVHHLIARHTTDEAMLSRLGQRADQQQDLRDALRNYRAKLKAL